MLTWMQLFRTRGHVHNGVQSLSRIAPAPSRGQGRCRYQTDMAIACYDPYPSPQVLWTWVMVGFWQVVAGLMVNGGYLSMLTCLEPLLL